MLTLVCVFFAQGQSQANDVNTVKAAIVKHALEMGVDPAMALSIARAESGFRQQARSSHGAVGVFQLKPSTAKGLGYNPYLLNDNIKCGILYYQRLYKMFGSQELALAAYNAGPAYVKKYRQVPPYAETRRFVNKIMADYNNQKRNPDPIVLNARLENAKVVPTAKPAASVKPVNVPEKTLKELDVQVIEQQAELIIEPETVAI